MIVDDMEAIAIELKRLKIWGEVSGFQITTVARNGYEALIKLQECPVELIITDIRMPIIDGIELLEKVKTKKIAPCVVLMSEYSEFELARKGLVLGAFDYLIKPINESDIVNLLKRTKQFLVQKRVEEVRQQIYDTSLYMNQIIELMKEGNDVEELAALTFDKIANSEIEILKIKVLIQRLTKEMLERIKNDLPWVTKFIDSRSFENGDFAKITCLDELKEKFISNIRQLRNLINNLSFSNYYDNIIIQISIYVLEKIDSEINLALIAESLYMNKNYLCVVFKQKTGISLLEYVTRAKMERAKVLLVQGEMKSYEVAHKLGYKDAEYFSKQFKKYTGITPSKYKNCKNP